MEAKKSQDVQLASWRPRTASNVISVHRQERLVSQTEVYQAERVRSPCCCSVAKLCSTLCASIDCSTPGSLSYTVSQSLLKFISIESVILSNHIILCHLLLLPSILPSLRTFSNESALPIRWPKCWSFSVSPSNEYSGMISFRIDWLDLLAVQGTLKSPYSNTTAQSINSLALSFLCGPYTMDVVLTSIHDYWKNHSFD